MGRLLYKSNIDSAAGGKGFRAAEEAGPAAGRRKGKLSWEQSWGRPTQGLIPPACVSAPLGSQAVFIDGIIAEALKAACWKQGARAWGWGGLGPTCSWELPLPHSPFFPLRPPNQTQLLMGPRLTASSPGRQCLTFSAPNSPRQCGQSLAPALGSGPS